MNKFRFAVIAVVALALGGGGILAASALGDSSTGATGTPVNLACATTYTVQLGLLSGATATPQFSNTYTTPACSPTVTQTIPGTTTTVTQTVTQTQTVTTPAATTTQTTPATTTSTTSTTPSAPVQPAGVPGNWALAFDDEFNGTSLNTTAWATHDGWTNQNAVTDHASNLSVTGGNLALTLASKTSGAAVETNSYALAVGQVVEIRAEFPGSGVTSYDWPAVWISGANWPASGENDIAESIVEGTPTSELTVNYHSPSGAHNQGPIPGTWTGAFHTYAIERLAKTAEVFWDGKLVKTYTTSDNGQPENVWLTMGYGGTAQIPSKLLVDYVRAWSPA